MFMTKYLTYKIKQLTNEFGFLEVEKMHWILIVCSNICLDLQGPVNIELYSLYYSLFLSSESLGLLAADLLFCSF